MNYSILLAALWAILATFTAFLPMRRQYVPGVTLLLLAPVLIGWLWVDFGWIVALLAALGFVSMFRNPLIYFYRRAKGDKPEIPK